MNDEMWKTQGGTIHLGCILDEHPDHPNVYKVCTTDGRYFPHAYPLSSDLDKNGFGEVTKPRIGSMCVICTTTDGAQPFILGFHGPARFDDESDVAPTADAAAANQTAGDKSYTTEGGGRLMMKRGGLVSFEGGPGASLMLNPVNNRATLRSANMGLAADGYRSSRGRKNVEGDSAETLEQSDYANQVGVSFDRVRLEHGQVDGSVRRRLTVASVVIVNGQEQEQVVTRETYDSSGTWVGEGPRYQWSADADEPAVLGNLLLDALTKIVQAVITLQVSTPFGVSTPPVSADVIRLGTELLPKLQAREMVSDFLFFAKSPTL